MLYRAAKHAYHAALRRDLPVYANADGIATPAEPGDYDPRTPPRGYKPEAITAIRDHINPGDRVIDIATGRGVFSALAANRSGELVRSYDASRRMLARSRRFHRLIGVDDSVILHHAVVGTPHDVYADMGDPDVIPPADLPSVDVFTLDCEGAELDILQGLTYSPRCVLVETHPNWGAPTSDVVAAIRDLGLRVESVCAMNESGKDFVAAVEP